LSLDSEDEWSASVLLHTSSAKEAMWIWQNIFIKHKCKFILHIWIPVTLLRHNKIADETEITPWPPPSQSIIFEKRWWTRLDLIIHELLFLPVNRHIGWQLFKSYLF
jgi:hypothetical protein